MIQYLKIEGKSDHSFTLEIPIKIKLQKRKTEEHAESILSGNLKWHYIHMHIHVQLYIGENTGTWLWGVSIDNCTNKRNKGAVGQIWKQLHRTLLYSDLKLEIVWLNTRWYVPAPPGSGKKTSFLLCIPNWNKAAVILTLLPVQRLFNGSWSHHLGKQHRGKTKQVTPLAMPSLLLPHTVYKLREANHNFTLWFVKSHSSTGGTEKTFKSIMFMVYRITDFPYGFYCSM